MFGANFACSRLGDATAKCVGRNDYGQIGNNSVAWAYSPSTVVTSSLKPAALSGIVRIQAAAGGGTSACAVLASGVVCWGNNNAGQLGDGTTTLQAAPVLVVNVP